MANAPFKRGDIVKHKRFPGAIAIVVETAYLYKYPVNVGINWVSGEVKTWRAQHPAYDFAACPTDLTILTETLDD